MKPRPAVSKVLSALLLAAAVAFICRHAFGQIHGASLLVQKAAVVNPQPPGINLGWNQIPIYEEILEGTNLLTPLTNWTVVARFTNNFPTNFYSTNDPAKSTKFVVIALCTSNGITIPNDGIWQFVVTTN